MTWSFTWFSRGLIDARRGRLDSATRTLQRGVDLLRWSGEPEYFLGIEELARIAESRGETTRAAALLRSAVDSRDHTYGARQWTAAFWARLSTDHARLSGREALTAEERRRLPRVHVAAGDRLARLP